MPRGLARPWSARSKAKRLHKKLMFAGKTSEGVCLALKDKLFFVTTPLPPKGPEQAEIGEKTSPAGAECTPGPRGTAVPWRNITCTSAPGTHRSTVE